MDTSDNIPTWKLDGIFGQSGTDEYTAYLSSCRERIGNIASLLESADKFTKQGNENFDFAAWLASFLKEYENCTAMCGTLCKYAYVSYSTDTTDPAKLNRLNETTDLVNSLLVYKRKLSLVLVSHKKYMEDFYVRFPEYKDYAYILTEMMDDSAHQMSAAEEKLASDMQKTGGEA